MSLPPRQQLILDQMEQALRAADARLASMFTAFGRVAQAQAQAMPSAEVIPGRPVRRVVLICVMVISMVGVIVLAIRTTSNDCPGLRSDQVAASAPVRYTGCAKSADVWSRGAR